MEMVMEAVVMTVMNDDVASAPAPEPTTAMVLKMNKQLHGDDDDTACCWCIAAFDATFRLLVQALVQVLFLLLME